MLVPRGEAGAAKRKSDAFAGPELGPNACFAAVRCTSNNGFTAFANTLESACGTLAFRSSIAFSVRSNSSVAVMAQDVVVVVGVVRVVVKLSIAEPSDVGIVRAEVICVGLHGASFAARCSHSAF